MLYIGAIPPELQRLFASVRSIVSAPQFNQLQKATLAMAVALSSRRNVKKLFALMDPMEGRTTLNDFFRSSPWPAPEVLRAATLEQIAQMKLQPGEEVQVLIDGTQKVKRGSKMDALGWVKEAGTTEWRKGHRILLCYLRIRGVLLPWAVDIYLSKKFLKTELGRDLRERRSETRFRTLNEMAAEMIATLPDAWATSQKVVVLMDSGFCNETACGAVRARGFHYVVSAQSSRTLVKDTPRGKKGQHVTLGAYAPGRIRYQGADITLEAKRAGGKCRRFRVADSLGTLKGLGKVKVVFSRRASDGNVLSLVASDVRETAREIALAYGWRWEIEVVTKGLKQRLGLGHYQCRNYEGMVHHLHLSLLAHLFLTNAALHKLGSDNITNRAALQLPSIADLQAQLRKSVWRGILADIRPHLADAACLNRLERALEAA